MDSGAVRNSVSGHAEQLVQAGVVHGGVHVHHSGGRRTSEALAMLRAAVLRQTTDEVAARGVYQFGELSIVWEGLPETMVEAESLAHGQSRTPRVLSNPGAVADAFLEMRARRLMLLGDAGSGKSTLALMLTRLLAERAAVNDAVPLPVLVSVSTWDPERAHLRVWFVRQLATLFPDIDRRLGRETLSELAGSGMVFPVLDGLDELLPRQRDLVFEALARSLTPTDAVILTCREKEFRDTGSAEELPALILRARPVSKSEVERYLTSGNVAARRRWDPLIKQLRAEPKGALGSALDSPLMLWLTRRTATEATLRLLADRTQFADAQAVRNHLLDALIPTAFRTGPSVDESQKNRWTAEKAQKYLRFLAIRFSKINFREIDLSYAASRSTTLIGQVSAIGVVLLLMGWQIVSSGGGPQHLGNFLVLLFVNIFPFVLALYAYRSLGSGNSRVFGFREAAILSCAVGSLVCAKFISNVLWRRLPEVLFCFFLSSLFFHLIRFRIRPGGGADPRDRLRRERYLSLAFLAACSLILCCKILVFPDRVQGLTRLQYLMGYILVVLLLDILILFCTPWGRWQCARAVLVLTGRLPHRTYAFLDEARQLGIIRLADGHYQFRHIRLQSRLAAFVDCAPMVGEAGSEFKESTQPYRYSRGLPWRRSLCKSSAIMMTYFIPCISILWPFPAGGGTVILVIFFLAWPVVVATRFTRRCLLLGASLSVTVDGGRLEVVHRGQRTVVTSANVRHVTMRTVRDGAGRPTRYRAVEVLPKNTLISPPGSFSSREQAVLIPLAPLHHFDATFRKALVEFAGASWEAPLHS
ncbi:NACHT domain-containing protein [Streptomyces californicus]|uniref:NACHT domain-containing protein n=1 Tax=Streptomyces californicus TaxID=67351 RepID=UPI0036D88CF2